MNVLTNVKEVTIADIVIKISEVIGCSLGAIECGELKNTDEILSSIHVGTNTNDVYTASYTFALKSNPNNSKVLNFFAIRNINNGDACIIISSGENDGLKVLFKSINKYPITGIEKYLPSIIKSTIAKL